MECAGGQNVPRAPEVQARFFYALGKAWEDCGDI